MFVVAGLVGPVACKCTKSEHAALKSTAEICRDRAKWPKRLHSSCSKCRALAAAPPGCEAYDEDYSAACAGQQREKLDAKSCEPVFRCSYKCKPTECDCVARCFEGHDECDKIAAAVDSCIAETCKSLCR